jgi:ABC-type antimicrobial peptide transport system permease subunit
MALGASERRVQFDVVAKAMRLAVIGVALGTTASFAVARWIASLLFGTTPTDPATFSGMILLLSTIALVAGYIPARRVSRIDPTRAL